MEGWNLPYIKFVNEYEIAEGFYRLVKLDIGTIGCLPYDIFSLTEKQLDYLKKNLESNEIPEFKELSLKEIKKYKNDTL